MQQTKLATDGRRGGSLAESLNRSKQALGGAATDALEAAATDLESLREDLKGLKETLTTFMSEAGNEAAKSTRDVSAALKAEGADMVADVAANVAQRGKGLMSDFEAMARRNPFGTLAGALVIGIVLASWGRWRR
jgi:ElaB/YqjD/DUF883 family membrane-anchored ribosome-binding protein